MEVLCFALFACAFILMLGFVGLLSFGHAAFFGNATYVAAHPAMADGWPIEFPLPAATIVAGGLGGAIGWVAIRRQGLYFAMITLAMSQLLYFVAVEWRITGERTDSRCSSRHSLRHRGSE